MLVLATLIGQLNSVRMLLFALVLLGKYFFKPMSLSRSRLFVEYPGRVTEHELLAADVTT